jgi:oxysterol-binding protein 1
MINKLSSEDTEEREFEDIKNDEDLEFNDFDDAAGDDSKDLEK